MLLLSPEMVLLFWFNFIALLEVWYTNSCTGVVHWLTWIWGRLTGIGAAGRWPADPTFGQGRGAIESQTGHGGLSEPNQAGWLL